MVGDTIGNILRYLKGTLSREFGSMGEKGSKTVLE